MKKNGLLIIDNIFPCSLSPFSYEEITNYLGEFDDSYVLCTGNYLPALTLDKIEVVIDKYIKCHKNFKNRVFKYSEEKIETLRPKLIYCIFLNTIYEFIEVIEKYNINFCFELYPGGGLSFDNEESDRKLQRVLKSPCFQKVIVSQNCVKEYLMSKEFCDAKKIEYKFGCVIGQDKIINEYKREFVFGKNKSSFDIMFMAHKYSPIGQDKGYDKFIEVAKKLCSLHDNFKFHVVGNWDETVIEIEQIKSNIEFYGSVDVKDMDSICNKMDIILSPNIPNILNKGGFDGFITASCIEAGLREVAVMCTDELKMNNKYFKDEDDIILIKPDVNDILEKIKYYYENPEKLYKIGISCKKKIQKLYNYENQIVFRNKVLKNTMNRIVIEKPDVKVSVIIPSYNHHKFIDKAIQSVLNQTYSNFELIIVDDASKDNSIEIIEKYNDPRIKKYYLKENIGAVSSLNLLIDMADGEYIALLNSDDLWLPTKLEKQVNFMECNKEIGACFTWANFIDDKGKEISREKVFYSDIFFKENRSQGMWLRYFYDNGNTLCHPSVLIRKKIYIQVGKLSNAYRQLPDYEFWIRLIKKYNIYIVQEVLTSHRRYDGEVSNTSAISFDNDTRQMYEINLIYDTFFDDISPKMFEEGFKDLVINKKCFENEHMCKYEQNMLVYKFNSLGPILRYCAYNKLAKMLDDENVYNLIHYNYGITYNDLYKLSTNRIHSLGEKEILLINPIEHSRGYRLLQKIYNSRKYYYLLKFRKKIRKIKDRIKK